ncbi:unnamed protein product, partial [Adineta steineri]
VVQLMREGLTRGKIQLAIANSSSLGFIELKNKLLDLNENVPRRLDIIKIFLLGRDYKQNDEPVWNNGNVLFTPDLRQFENIFNTLGFDGEWAKIKEEYMKRNLHVYRDGFNRHGHGNTKPSYWAYGYMTLQMYKDTISPEEFQEYSLTQTQTQTQLNQTNSSQTTGLAYYCGGISSYTLWQTFSSDGIT